MRAGQILARFVTPFLGVVHAARREAVLGIATVLVSARRLSSAAIGRAIPGKVAPKHNIKRVDRLLVNEHLHKELATFYSAIASVVLKGVATPIVLVDWTRLNDGFCALSAVVPASGRGVPIYFEVHSMKHWHNTERHVAFLSRLKELIPKNCTPILVSDAGFQVCWFRELVRLGWHFIGNLNPTVKAAAHADADWDYVSSHFDTATYKARSLGKQLVSKTHRLDAKLILFKPKPKGRKGPPAHKRKSVQEKARKKAKSPCMLATSLSNWSSKEVLRVYRLRMQIEETFRDAKSHRFGWSLVHARSANPMRWSVLLLLASLAMLLVHLLGAALKSAGRHRAYQANTTARPVLSAFTLGVLMVVRNEDDLAVSAIDDVLEALRNALAATTPLPAIRSVN